MAESFGARLRQQRERQQIALTAIADRTKINIALLEGLERDDLSHWPSGIFRRAFIRGYAQTIGLEPVAVVREFLELYPEPEDESGIVHEAVDPAASGQRPPTRLQCLLASAFPSLSRSRPPVVHALIAPARVVAPASSAAAAPVVLHGVPEVIEVPEVADVAEVNEVPDFNEVPEINEVIAAIAELPAPPPPEPDLSAVAHLCTSLARVLAIREVEPLLGSAARLLDAVGLIVWVWDPRAAVLTPALSHGYPDDMLAKLPRVRRDTDNATAAAFRAEQPRIVNGTDLSSGAVVVPLLTPGGCVGVLAVELRHGGERRESVRALASILAAQLATFVGLEPLAEAVSA